MGNTKTFLLMAVMTALLMGLGYAFGGLVGALMALCLAGGTNFWAWWHSDKVILKQQNARLVTEDDAADLVHLVADLAIKADLPMPAVYVINTEQPNAFATGRDPDHAAVAVTVGLLRHLNRQEIAGVIAHELAHIRHRDTLLMTVTATMAGAIGMLGNMMVLSGGRDGRGHGIGGLLAMIVAPLAAGMVQFAISRSREFAADRGAAEITGQPMALASALAKIAELSGRIANAPAQQHPASAAMFIINPLHGGELSRLFATHPSTQSRIIALKDMAGR